MTSWDMEKISTEIIKHQIEISGIRTELAKLMLDTMLRLDALEYDYRKRRMPQTSMPEDREYERMTGLGDKIEEFKKRKTSAEKLSSAVKCPTDQACDCLSKEPL